jgi:hypothetical protein
MNQMMIPRTKLFAGARDDASEVRPWFALRHVVVNNVVNNDEHNETVRADR